MTPVTTVNRSHGLGMQRRNKKKTKTEKATRKNVAGYIRGLIGASGLSFGVALVSKRAQNWNEIK